MPFRKMQLLKEHKWVFLTLFVFVSIAAGCSIIIITKYQQLNTERNTLCRLQQELRSLLLLQTAPVQKSIEVYNKSVEQIYDTRNRWIESFGSIQFSNTPIDCRLKLQIEIDLLKRNAHLANVTINSRCYFGFLKYLGTKKLPAVESLSEIDRQCQIIKAISNILIESKPNEILFLSREPVTGEIDLEDDLFRVGVGERLNLHNIFSSNVFKIAFTGTTEVLRSFINKIESIKGPIFIRRIGVNKPSGAKLPAMATEELPNFSITLEVLDIKTELL